MSTIVYRRAEYGRQADRQQILALYKAVFHVDVAYDSLLCGPWQPLGVVAADRDSGKIIGHFASLRFEAEISGKLRPFRISMGFMVSPERRGEGIALRLYEQLRQAAREDGAAFIIGFPNDVSYKMHVERMEYELYKNFHFVRLPRGTPHGSYTLIEEIPPTEYQEPPQEGNHLLHSGAYLSRRYAEDKYDKWRSKSGHIFVSTRFMDKADILYWSGSAGVGELLDFAAFLYEAQGVDRVTTWNTAPFLDPFPGEEREYHMCINYLNCSPAEKAEIQKSWFFYMGDCELF